MLIGLLMLALPLISFSQDKIQLMNGTVLTGKLLVSSSFAIQYQFVKKSGKVKVLDMPTERVFSTIDSTGKETLWYFQDVIVGNDLSVDEMRWFIKGQQDARDGYKSPWATWGGFLLGAGAVIGFDLEVNSLLLPPIWAGISAFPRVNVTKGSIRDPLMEGNEFYAYGYSRVGRTKRVLRGLLGSFAGVAVGLLTRSVINNNQ